MVGVATGFGSISRCANMVRGLLLPVSHHIACPPRVGSPSLSQCSNKCLRQLKRLTDHQDRIFCTVHYAYFRPLHLDFRHRLDRLSCKIPLTLIFRPTSRPRRHSSAERCGTPKLSLSIQLTGLQSPGEGLANVPWTNRRFQLLIDLARIMMWSSIWSQGRLLTGLWLLQGALAALTGDRACGEVCDLSLAINIDPGSGRWAVALTSRSSVYRRFTIQTLK